MPGSMNGVRSGKPRIVYFVNCFPNFIETMIYREVLALRALGYDICAVSIRKPKRSDVPPEATSLMNDTVYILPMGWWQLVRAHVQLLARQPVQYVRAFAEVMRGAHDSMRDRFRTLCHFVEAVAILPAVKAMQADHLHAHWAVGSATVAMVVSRLLGIPFTFTAHAYDIWRDRLILPEKLQAARMTFTCTDYNRRHLIEAYGVDSEKVRVIYHGLDVERFPARQSQEGTNAEPVVLSVGRLVEQKGFDRLLRACAHLIAEGHRVRCEIVGEGPLRSALEALTRELGLGDHVRFHGWLLADDLIQRYVQADIFALSCVQASDNDRDGIPNTLIEAMAMELPVVSTRYSGIPELVEEGVSGLLVEPDDSDALLSALRLLLTDAGLRRQLGTAARRRVLQGFSIGRSARELDAVFTSLGAGRWDPVRS